MFRAHKRLRPGVLSSESNMIGFRAKKPFPTGTAQAQRPDTVVRTRPTLKLVKVARLDKPLRAGRNRPDFSR